MRPTKKNIVHKLKGEVEDIGQFKRRIELKCGTQDAIASVSIKDHQKRLTGFKTDLLSRGIHNQLSCKYYLYAISKLLSKNSTTFGERKLEILGYRESALIAELREKNKQLLYDGLERDRSLERLKRRLDEAMSDLDRCALKSHNKDNRISEMETLLEENDTMIAMLS